MQSCFLCIRYVDADKKIIRNFGVFEKVDDFVSDDGLFRIPNDQTPNEQSKFFYKPVNIAEEELDFSTIQKNFSDHLQGILGMIIYGKMLPGLVASLRLNSIKDKHLKILSKNHDIREDCEILEFDPHHLGGLTRKISKAHFEATSAAQFLRLMILGLVSQFDAYMGRVLRLAIDDRPDIAMKSQKQFPAHEVFSFPDVESFKEAVTDREIEGFLRKSHAEQFDWISDTFNIKTKDGLERWPLFIETCERRNLFSHSNGVVSQNYIIKCASAGLDDLPPRGAFLDVDEKYLYERTCVFLEIGVLVSQVISRKIDSSNENLEKMDEVLNHIGYDLILHGHFEVAKSILKFGCALKRHGSAMMKSMMVINYANAAKLAGDSDLSARILSEVDWSIYDAQFRISERAICNDVDSVISLMHEIGDSEKFPRKNYIEWPVFSHVQENILFQEAYKEIFGEEYPILQKSV